MGNSIFPMKAMIFENHDFFGTNPSITHAGWLQKPNIGADKMFSVHVTLRNEVWTLI